jgi:hypothetical protein
MERLGLLTHETVVRFWEAGGHGIRIISRGDSDQSL